MGVELDFFLIEDNSGKISMLPDGTIIVELVRWNWFALLLNRFFVFEMQKLEINLGNLDDSESAVKLSVYRWMKISFIQFRSALC